jgi:UDP-N-acetylmuramyl pentapeptide phosphotransferase/UDP-N-acetylglucosamine-1-phosphate transferase
LAGRAATVAAGAVLARAAWRVLAATPPGGEQRWRRTNHRGEPVTLVEGPALALATAAAASLVPGVPGRVRAGAVLATLGAAGFGALDDLAEAGSGPVKGLRGHLGALARGEVTTGGAKVAGIGLTGLAAAALALGRDDDGGRAGFGDVVAAGALVAATANVVNLLDLRPGRALKAVLLHAPMAITAGPGGTLVAVALGPAAALLPEDLAERAMLGDTGANAAGALLGTALVARLPRRARLAALAATVALTLASERVSFTRVIEATPGLRELDALGRRPR